MQDESQLMANQGGSDRDAANLGNDLRRRGGMIPSSVQHVELFLGLEEFNA
jgi:hypothetical protein